MCYNVKRMCIKSSPFGEGRSGVLGLLKPADPEPETAGVPVHADVNTAEGQAARAVAAISTRRPIETAVANVE